jgi:lysophospholipase L1-like esterase
MKGSSRVVITDEKSSKLYVFGASSGNNITVYNGNELIFKKKSTTTEYYIPDSFDISSSGFDYNSDSLVVKIDGELTGFHELYFSPRRYIATENRPFDREIRNFVMHDRHFPAPSNSVLFVGSSSIRMWNSLNGDFPELKIIHRGFGGSTAEDAVRYMEEIILPYDASTIVIYEGDNDVMRGYSGQKISDDMRKIIDRVSSENSETKILIVSPKPSISRMHVWDKYKAAHSALVLLANEYENVEFVDVSTPMFDKNGKLKEEIFVSDGVHMNEAGYAIWTQILREKLGLN